MICIAEHQFACPRQPLFSISEKFCGVACSSGGAVEKLEAPSAKLTDPASRYANLARVEFQHFRSGEFEGEAERLYRRLGQSGMGDSSEVKLDEICNLKRRKVMIAEYWGFCILPASSFLPGQRNVQVKVEGQFFAP